MSNKKIVDVDLNIFVKRMSLFFFGLSISFLILLFGNSKYLEAKANKELEERKASLEVALNSSSEDYNEQISKEIERDIEIRNKYEMEIDGVVIRNTVQEKLDLFEEAKSKYQNIEELIGTGQLEDNGEVFFDDYKNLVLKIDSIGVLSIIESSNGVSQQDYYKTIRTNVSLIGVYPKQSGTTFLSAHSSAPRFNKLGIQALFKDLNKLKIGEKIQIRSNRYTYEYEIQYRDKLTTEEGKKLLNYTKRNKLILMTCPEIGDENFENSRVFITAFLSKVTLNN